MKDGEIVEAGSAEAILNAPQHPYTRALMTAAFDLQTAAN
jgi:microcin C transport system ATP-binding protein